ncbi:hypothetical protein BDW42DRAFT_109920 [Aspergillus taichungensis]|uniref:Uncharacterized protein n=1 Tax=Aspergillus taichungensis TaxID=482145 RepID=A0A2J5I8G5_9EURO|nr:hypothetical protein BDW42DRAFT_109920 [Aspergillus taichungensis]
MTISLPNVEIGPGFNGVSSSAWPWAMGSSFSSKPTYGWYLSITAIGLNISFSFHNLIAWIKIRGFFTQQSSRVYLVSLLLAQPYWILEIYANFAFSSDGNPLFVTTRPLEPLFRDTWWIFTTCSLFYTIQRGYDCPLAQLVRIIPRFGIMLLFMALSILSTIVDTGEVLGACYLGFPPGIEPFWKVTS